MAYIQIMMELFGFMTSSSQTLQKKPILTLSIKKHLTFYNLVQHGGYSSASVLFLYWLIKYTIAPWWVIVGWAILFTIGMLYIYAINVKNDWPIFELRASLAVSFLEFFTLGHYYFMAFGAGLLLMKYPTQRPVSLVGFLILYLLPAYLILLLIQLGRIISCIMHDVYWMKEVQQLLKLFDDNDGLQFGEPVSNAIRNIKHDVKKYYHDGHAPDYQTSRAISNKAALVLYVTSQYPDNNASVLFEAGSQERDWYSACLEYINDNNLKPPGGGLMH